MIETSSALTLSLAKAFGVYMIAGGLSGLTSRDRWAAILDEFKTRPGLTYISGVFVFALGVAIILAHNIWADPLAIFVSLVGWGAALEGLVLIAYPAPLLNWSATFLKPGAVRIWAIAITLFGIALLIFGFTGRVGL